MNIFKQKRITIILDRWIFYAILAMIFFLALEPVIATAALIAGMLFYMIKICILHGVRFRRTLFDIPIGLFLLFGMLSVPMSPDPGFSFYNFYNLAGRYVLTYVLVVQNVTTVEQIKKMSCALGVSAVVVVLYGFYQYIFGIDISTMKWVDGNAFPELKTRIFSTWVNPNILAGYLDIALCIVFGLFVMMKQKRTRCILAGGFILLAICLVMTYARGACLSIAIVLAGYGLLKDRRILFGCIAFGTVVLLVDTTLAERLAAVFTKIDTSSEMRLALWESTIAMIIDHPLLGIGWGAYWMVYPEYDFYINDAAVRIVHAHNMYLNYAAEIGLVGAAGFFWYFFGTMWLALSSRYLRGSAFLNGLLLGLGLAVLSIAFNGLTDYVLFNIPSSMLFWLIAAMTVLIEKNMVD